MRSLLSKILLSLVISVVIALLVVVLITRISLSRGMVHFIEQQEAGQLEKLVPELAELYRQQGDWGLLRGNPRRWGRLIRLTRPSLPNTGEAPERRRRPEFSAGARRPPLSDRLNLPRRLFLLDAQKARVAGAVTSAGENYRMEPVEVEGKVVGWVGIVPARIGLPWDAQRFLNKQARALIISLVIALVLVSVVGFLLARHLSRPVIDLANVVAALTRGEYAERAVIRTRDEIGALCRDVNRLAQTLEKNQTARRRWMADIAHELRTPVAILKGEIEALEDGVRSVNAQTTTSLREEVDHLARLVDDLQTLALSDAGALNLQIESVNLSVLTRQSGEAYRARLAARGIELRLHIGEGIMLNADPQRLKQLLHNLLENCRRYVDQGGRVSLSLAANDRTVVLSLDDSGPGLEAEHMEHLFERFYRVEGSRSRSTGGSGLGLAICRNIVETHQGNIRAENSSMGGLGIRVELPGY
ncbi:MAG: HAMP domain-containing protein [Proteobacteria bacterium]|nr:HAMP domain-containing protein [Pseudomonadota bacterium]